MIEEQAQSNPEAPKVAPTGNKDVEDNKIFAVLGYIGILFLIPLLAKKDSPFAQFHAKQGMILFIAGIIASFVIWIPFVGWAIGIFMFVLWIMGVINALGGQMKELPVIGGFAKKINI